MESLQDLGKDTLYSSGEQITPEKEVEGQPRCKPITDWRFTVGSGIKEKAVIGPWGALSIVTGAESTSILTEDTTPLRGWDGGVIPGASIKGATTFELNQAQAERSARNGLWIQGGTTTDPVLFNEPKFQDKYGFGALRCSIDNLNGDNVETIAFPTGTRHAFCYAYYVTPPPGAGAIVIRKEVKGSGSAPQEFDFGGNVSYNPGGVFDLSASNGNPGEQTFVRGETRPGEDPWTANEDVPAGWVLTDIRCDAGPSEVSTNLKEKNVAIHLAPADTVTCTFVDTLRPPKGALLLRKVTEKGVGSFHFRVLDSNGDAVGTRTITTKHEGDPSYSKPMLLDPGAYTVFERRPKDPHGVWRLVDVSCNGTKRDGNGADVSVTDKKGVLCAFTNRLSYEGRISIRKETIGSTGIAAFQITSPSHPERELRQVAEVHKEKTPVRARGDSSRGLPFGTYEIQESDAGPAQDGSWALAEVICNGRAVPFEQGRAEVRLSERSPTTACRFVNVFTPGPPPPKPGPEPEPGDKAELVVEKTLISSGSGPTPTATFRITVTNQSQTPADNVVVTDQPGSGLAIVSAKPSQGECIHQPDYVCVLGTIQPGGRATVTVTAKNYSGRTHSTRRSPVPAAPRQRRRTTPRGPSSARQSAISRPADPASASPTRPADGETGERARRLAPDRRRGPPRPLLRAQPAERRGQPDPRQGDDAADLRPSDRRVARCPRRLGAAAAAALAIELELAPGGQDADRRRLDLAELGEELPGRRRDADRGGHRPLPVCACRGPLRIAGEVAGVAVDRSAAGLVAE